MSSMLCPVLVGREEHARALRGGLEAALGGMGRVVALMGEAGVGKSRRRLQAAFRTRRPPNVDEIRAFVAALAGLIPDWRSEAAGSPSDQRVVAVGRKPVISSGVSAA